MASHSSKGKRKKDDKVHIVKQTLERVRRKLVDISRRNNLINFRETRRTIRIIHELPNETFRLLVSEGKPMEFLPFEPPEEEESKEKGQDDVAQEQLPFNQHRKIGYKAQANGNNSKSYKIGTQRSMPVIDKSYELPESTKEPEPKHIDKRLQTPLLDQPLERRCKKFMRHWRTGIEDAGINYLYLAIGFLEWRESDDSDQVNKAPLILVPLRIERTRLNTKTNCYTYVIFYSGEDIETNLSLAEKLDHDFDLILPELTEDSAPENYIDQVKETINKKGSSPN